MSNDNALEKLTAAARQGRLLVVWGDLPWPPSNGGETRRAITQRWQRAAHLTPITWPLAQLPPVTILSLDPTNRLPAIFQAAGKPLAVLSSAADALPNKSQHILLPLGGNLSSGAGLLLTWHEVNALPMQPDKAWLLSAAAQACTGGAVLALAPGESTAFATIWQTVLTMLLPVPAFGLGPGSWPKSITPLALAPAVVFAALHPPPPPPPKRKNGPMMESYVDFELHVAPDGRAVARSEEGASPATQISIQLPANIRLTLSLIEKDQTDAELLKSFGQELYQLLFPGPIHTHFQQTEAVARAARNKLRIRLRIEADTLASLPLEFLYRTLHGYFFAINPSTVLSRYLDLPMPGRWVRRREGPLHLLVIIADPSDQTRLPPAEWEAIVRQALAEPLSTNQLTLQVVPRATRRAIRDALLHAKPDLIQFIGHGVYSNGKGYLALVDDKTNQTWLVDDERFAGLFLGADDHLGLVSLATCESAKSDAPTRFLGIAPQLIQRGTPAVVAMQYPVLIETAQIFLEDFYTAIAAHKPVDWAVQMARKGIADVLDLNNREFATPVLYMRAKDGEIF